MTALVLRGLCLLAFSLLAACQSAGQSTEPSPQGYSSALQYFEQALAKGNLEEAEEQLNNLEQSAASQTELESYQRLLADAYLQRGQSALHSGDLNTAASALGRARDLLPKAPALTSGITQVITPAKRTVLEMPALDDQDALNKALDELAAEVVKNNRSVRIEAGDSQQTAQLKALLESRIQQLKPGFKALYSAKVNPGQERPRVVLLPGY